jgi:hypothetical protein
MSGERVIDADREREEEEDELLAVKQHGLAG